MRTVRANEPGTPIWNELLTPDIGRATQFYADVLGLTARTPPVPWADAADLHDVQLRRPADRRRWPPPLEEAPPHWNVYFNVVDVDEAVAQADALGAKLIVPPYDLEGTGRMATLTDPHGALFCLMAS